MKAAVCLTALLLLSTVLSAQLDKCSALQLHGKRAEASACFTVMTRSRDAFTRATGYAGLHQYRQANDEFRQADKDNPASAAVKTAWGNLFLQNAQPKDAMSLFDEATKADPNYAPAYLGMSKAVAEGYDKNAVALAKAALEHDSKYYAAHEFLGYLALEDGDESLAAEESNKAIAISSDALEGMAVLASIDFLKGDGANLRDNSPWLDRILNIDPYYGGAYVTAAHFLEINYRFNEAITAYRKALALDPDLVAARSQLGVNLMRVGQTEEAQKQLQQCFQQHFRNAETVNSLRFLDTMSQYERFTTDSTELLLNKSEAALLRPYIEPELKLAMATYERKYNLKLPARVRLEVYPNHDDFVVRTLGLPGQGGLLGVTFGTVVAIDSPSARPAGDFSWADTMWHELCHVYVITATHNLVPRWFSEGLAVHEEGVASPQWGNRLNPDTIAALKQKKLLPVLKLDAGFVRPEYPTQVLVSYYQAGEICDYIAERWGDSAILGMIHSYAAHKTTQEAIQDNLHESPETFDKEFLAWIDKHTEMVVTHFDQWKAGMNAAAADLQQGNASSALGKVQSVQNYYPGYPATLQILAKCYSSVGKKQEAMTALEQYQTAGGTDVAELKQLAQMETDAARPKKAIMALEEINLIYPEDMETHQRLGELLLKDSKSAEAIQEFRAALALKPSDTAAAHFDLARALSAAHQTSEAKDQVLLALEAAPNFKPAQQLLLQLSQ
jgi:tetratricopeptide (TPR) repeat protein